MEEIAKESMSTLIIVTGGSRGFGYACANRAVKKFSLSSSSLHLVILARNLENLEKAKKNIENNNVDVNLHVLVKQCDLQNDNDETLKQLMDHVVQESGGVNEFQRVVIIHNAAEMGDPSSRTWEDVSSEKLAHYFQMNISATAVLQAHLMKIFEGRLLDFASGKNDFEMCVVNVTSLAGIVPFTYLSYYCTGKSAREMWFRCLAEEAKLTFSREDKCAVIVLSYAPGPMKTDLFEEFLEKAPQVEWSDSLKNLLKEGKTVDTNISADKMLRVLMDERTKWKSGDHVDIFDEI